MFRKNYRLFYKYTTVSLSIYVLIVGALLLWSVKTYCIVSPIVAYKELSPVDNKVFVSNQRLPPETFENRKFLLKNHLIILHSSYLMLNIAGIFIFIRKIKKHILTSHRIETELEDRLIRIENTLNERTRDLEMETMERKRIQVALQRSEQKFKRLSESAFEGIIIHKDLKILDLNKTLSEMFGYEPAEMTGRHIFDFLTGESIEIACAMIESGNEVPYEVQGIKKDGSMFTLEVRPSVLEENCHQYRMVACSDLTERKRYEQALIESEGRLRLLLNSTAEAIYGVDNEGNCTFANTSCLRLLGYNSVDEIIGKQMHSMVHHSNPDGSAYPFEKSEIQTKVINGKPFHLPQTTLWRKDGTSFNAEVWIYPICRNQTMLGAVVTFLDITDRVMLQLKLQQAQKMESIGTLAGGIAHDFNNILSIIMGCTELALDQIEKNESLYDFLSQSLMATYRAKDLVNRILTFSRQDEKKNVPLVLKHIVEETVKLLRSILPSSIIIQQQIPVGKGVVLGDATQIQQIILNLSSNASQSMDEKGGVLTISLTDEYIEQIETPEGSKLPPGPYVRLTISDTGKGIPPENLERIFDPYFTTKKKGEGTGLGLSVVHGIVQSHNGVITVQSEIGKGTTFDLFFPSIDMPGAQDGTAEDMGSLVGNERIFIIDDEAVILHLESEILKELGYQVFSFNNSLEALEVLQRNPTIVDLIITDQTMPFKTGKELAKDIFQIRPDIPIILCTGYSEYISREDAQDIGIREFILKPFSKETLGIAVRKALDKNELNGLKK